MHDQKKVTELSWGWSGGMALGVGSAVGVAWESWILFFVVTSAIIILVVWRSQQ